LLQPIHDAPTLDLWKGDQVEIMQADIMFNEATSDLDPWQSEGTSCLSSQNWNGQCLNVTDQGVEIMEDDS
jgi:hypothetical protein